MPKQLRLLAGRTLLEHCVAAFDQAPSVDEVLVVIAGEFAAQVTAELGRYGKLAGVVPGGGARTDSTRQAITAIGLLGVSATCCSMTPRDRWSTSGSSPTVSPRSSSWQAIGVVVPSPDTIVEVAEGTLGRVLPRDSLARCQTPQGFRFSVIRRAYELAAADPGFAALSATDDCGVVRRYLPDVPIGAVPGSERNMKITYPGDLAIAEALLRQDPGTRCLPRPAKISNGARTLPMRIKVPVQSTDSSQLDHDPLFRNGRARRTGRSRSMRVVVAGAVALACGLGGLTAPLSAAASPAAASGSVTRITLNLKGGGRVYDGVGARSRGRRQCPLPAWTTRPASASRSWTTCSSPATGRRCRSSSWRSAATPTPPTAPSRASSTPRAR